jgi:hypothetical protein
VLRQLRAFQGYPENRVAHSIVAELGGRCSRGGWSACNAGKAREGRSSSTSGFEGDGTGVEACREAAAVGLGFVRVRFWLC